MDNQMTIDFSNEVNNYPFLEIKKWKEFHKNGKLHIDGQIGILPERLKHLYNYRTQWKNYEGKIVVRIGVWTNFYDNGQIWWKIDFGDSMLESKVKREKFPSYRKDGTII